MRAIRRRCALLVHHVDRCLVAVERCDERMLLGKELEGDVVRCQGIAELLHSRRYIALLLLRSYLGSSLHRGQSYALAPCSSRLIAHTRSNSIHVLVGLKTVKGVLEECPCAPRNTGWCPAGEPCAARGVARQQLCSDHKVAPVSLHLNVNSCALLHASARCLIHCLRIARPLGPCTHGTTGTQPKYETPDTRVSGHTSSVNSSGWGATTFAAVLLLFLPILMSCTELWEQVCFKR